MIKLPTDQIKSSVILDEAKMHANVMVTCESHV